VSLRVRMGPFSVSSRGRVGVSAGPVSWSGGGGGSGGSGAFAALIGLVLVVGLVIVVVMWPLSVWGHAIHLTPSWHQLMNRDKAWMHEHYSLVGLRYAGAAASLLTIAFVALRPVGTRYLRHAAERAAEEERQLAQAHRQWLEAPPPFLTLPGRFTENWIANNVPLLHPGQVPILMDELRARGWTEARIAQRVTPYLAEYETSTPL
jgi:hypothetical protein